MISSSTRDAPYTAQQLRPRRHVRLLLPGLFWAQGAAVPLVEAIPHQASAGKYRKT